MIYVYICTSILCMQPFSSALVAIHFARETWNPAHSMIPTDEYIPVQSHEKWQVNNAGTQGSFEHQTADVLNKKGKQQTRTIVIMYISYLVASLVELPLHFTHLLTTPFAPRAYEGGQRLPHWPIPVPKTTSIGEALLKMGELVTVGTL